MVQSRCFSSCCKPGMSTCAINMIKAYCTVKYCVVSLLGAHLHMDPVESKSAPSESCPVLGCSCHGLPPCILGSCRLHRGASPGTSWGAQMIVLMHRGPREFSTDCRSSRLLALCTLGGVLMCTELGNSYCYNLQNSPTLCTLGHTANS